MLPLHRLVHELVVDPSPAVARDLVARLDDGPGGGGMALEGHGHGEHADGDPPLGEDAEEPPEADPAPVLVHRLHLEVARPRQRRRPDHLAQEPLGLLVPVED